VLILTRKLDESIVIGNDIEVKVVSIAGNQVHIGISAPRDVPIYRHEVYEKVRSGNQEAVKGGGKKASRSAVLANLARRAAGQASSEQ
jgi:carbon storage regulator